MMPADVKADIKQQEIKDLVASRILKLFIRSSRLPSIRNIK